MHWKMNGDNIVLSGGNPVWVEGDKDVPVDYLSISSRLTDTTRESIKRKEKLRELEGRLSVLDGIDDPGKFMADAKKAMETVKNLDDKQLVEVGKVEEVKAEVTKVMQVKIDEAIKRADEAAEILQKEMIGGNFARSKFIADKIAVPTDMIEATFGRHFNIEEGKVLAKGHDGQPLYSREKPGEVAGFDEALSILVDGYANKDAILKGSDASGGGTNPGGGGGDANSRTISRSEFEKLDPTARMSFFKDGVGKVTE